LARSPRAEVRPLVIASEPVAVTTLCDESGLVAQRYGGTRRAYLIRGPACCGRFAAPTADGIAAALARAKAEADEMVTEWNFAPPRRYLCG